MRPILFDEANKTLTGGEKDLTIGHFPVFDDGQHIIGCFEVSDEEIIEIYKNKKIWLSVLTSRGTLPPLSILAYKPFE